MEQQHKAIKTAEYYAGKPCRLAPTRSLLKNSFGILSDHNILGLFIAGIRYVDETTNEKSFFNNLLGCEFVDRPNTEVPAVCGGSV
jgi:hypothetical protein